jgi:LmbE family N-acetylglucosaminyl deacetylase
MKVLIVDAHPDDGEISAGGTIARLVREGHEVRTVYFCPCTEAKENKGHLGDHKRACNILGIVEIIKYDYPRDGYLEVHKQEIRNELWKIRELYQPDLVLCPSPHDFHQDHCSIADCCLTIFRDTSTILGFEVMRSVTPDFKPTLYILLTEEDLSLKMYVVDAYKSQMTGRPYFFSRQKFLAQVIYRGTQAKTEFAEAFEVLWGRL